MARGNNLPAKIYSAGERTETTLRFQWDAGDGNTTNTIYIDLAKALSQINRRAYRQGLYYYVASVTFSNGTDAYCQVLTLPDTWMTKRAWMRGFQIWSKMNRIAAAGDSGVYPKYHDYKVTMISGVTPIDLSYGKVGTTTGYTSDDWVASQYVTEDPYLHGGAASDTPVEAHNADQFTAHMLGGHTGSSGAWTSIGLIQSLNDVWRLDPAEGVPSLDADADTDALAALFDAADVTDDVRLNMDEDNDEPPYNHDRFTGLSVEEGAHGVVLRTGVGGSAISSGPGFCAPLGLLQVNVTDFNVGSSSIDVVEMIIEMVPGTYNGVYAERIL